jgi:23S rRNA pseudouridine1911/1915/1917 synthase
MDINIVYEDDFILVVDKKEGLPVVPSGRHDIALANGILAYYQTIGLKSTVHFVNRLDKDTSGLLVVAKYRHVHHLMTTDIKAVTRKYYARVGGILRDFGCIDARIFRPSADSIKRVVHPSGQRAITHYETVQHFETSTLVRCILETGRTHQIRVHMAHIGHPILKDPLYGDGGDGDKQLLHSYFLEFVHPISGEKLSFETEVPERF